jgi:glutamyl-tRNA(Gln) amidotransferase subunit E
MALEGVPKETRKMLEGGSTAYMRPLPGAARMYPETDVFPVRVTPERYASYEIPEMIDDTIERYIREFGFTRELARQMAYLNEERRLRGCCCRNKTSPRRACL